MSFARLDASLIDSSPVNSGVMSPLRIQRKNFSRRTSIEERSTCVDNSRGGLRVMRIESTHAERTWHRASAIMWEVKNPKAFGAAEQAATT